MTEQKRERCTYTEKHTGRLNSFLGQTPHHGNILTYPMVTLHLCLVLPQVPSLGLGEFLAFLGQALLVKKKLAWKHSK